MTQDDLKKMAAAAAIHYLEDDMIIGVGSGSTINFFIDALKTHKHRLEGACCASIETESRLKALGIRVLDLNTINDLPLYVDGADEINEHHQLIKGGGGALTREKILSSAAKKFICIADESKFVPLLGERPVPLEVIPMARSFVGRQILKKQGSPSYREHFLTDNHNIILDVYNLPMQNPIKLEDELKLIPGVVENGIFAHRPADIVLLGTPQGVKTM